MNNEVEKVTPSGVFTNYIFKSIPLAFDESMSYYECLCGLLDYLKNTVIPTINNNADAIIEVQENVSDFETNITSDFQEFTTDITNDFNDYKTLINNTVEELETYVNNYFDNLDVQEEIDNKLDEMVLDGTMDQIVNTNITGTLSNLQTTNKSNLVSAINEVNTKTINEGTYSSTETVVGKWIDNKPIYRKVITANNLTPTGPDYLNIPHGISNLDKVVSIKTIADSGDGTFYDFNNYSWYDESQGETSLNSTLHLFVSNQDIMIFYQGSHYINFVSKAYFILEYTKTTD